MAQYVACLKHGTKYSSKYVNTLKNMVDRHLKIEHTFICFTEDPEGLDPSIEVIPLPEMGLSGPEKAWWYKLKMFDPDLKLRGTLLFLDLDVVLISSIDKLFTYQPNKFCIIQDFFRAENPNHYIRNSSVFRLEIGSYPEVWNQFVMLKDQIVQTFDGDQDWITNQINDEVLWPRDWIISYRWELKKRLGEDQGQYLPYDEETTPPEECSILVFHGYPNPEEVTQTDKPDPLILRHWK